MNNVGAGSTGDDSGADDHSEINVVELQLCGGASSRHLGKINNEGFCL